MHALSMQARGFLDAQGSISIDTASILFAVQLAAVHREAQFASDDFHAILSQVLHKELPEARAAISACAASLDDVSSHGKCAE